MFYLNCWVFQMLSVNYYKFCLGILICFVDLFIMFICKIVFFILLNHHVVVPFNSQEAPDNGFLKREFSLLKPYATSGMGIPFWDLSGNAMMTNSYIRLTSNHQGQQGAVWSKVPCYLRDWEMQVNFKIYGDRRSLAADGIALWYTSSRMMPGPVFGSQDEFKGLGVFLDTYKNGNQQHTFPQISAMVGNGTEKYDHLSDGDQHAIGYCLGALRNKDYDTQISIRYVKKVLTVSVDVDGLDQWKTCFEVSGVTLPAGYYFGATAATGDLADNHHIIGVKFYELEVERTAEELAEDWSTAKPSVSFFKPPLDHRDDGSSGGYRNSAVYGIKLFMIILCAIIGLVICAVVGVLVFQKRQQENRKRFY